ncbi:MAG: zinc-finger domain-containing protein [Planktomarina sp.]
MATQAPETKITNAKRFSCDGGEGALGHPRVWLQIPADSDFVECPYCDAKYVYKDAD